jgi:acyl-CoA synthetase (AMP-forming)/AMP-acid ligase II
MPDNTIVPTPSAYAYPLLVKQLLLNSVSLHGDQQITYRGELRFTFREFRERVGKLASALASLGVRHGTTVAVMDWDSHRYLESYFAIPMMGATMFTVNVRLSPQQIAYTLNDAEAEAEVVLVHADFVPVLEQLAPGLTSVRRIKTGGDWVLSIEVKRMRATSSSTTRSRRPASARSAGRCCASGRPDRDVGSRRGQGLSPADATPNAAPIRRTRRPGSAC